MRIAAVVLAAWVVCPRPASALKVENRDHVSLGSTEAFADDLLVYGTAIDSSATVHGDLIAVGHDVTIGGHVTGDLFVSGVDVVINGRVDGTVRVAGWNVRVAGSTSGDVLAAGSAVAFGETSRVGRDLLAAAGRFSLNGSVGRDVRGRWNAGVVGSGARIDGSLLYEAPPSPGSTVVKGQVGGIVLGRAPSPGSPLWETILRQLLALAIVSFALTLLASRWLAVHSAAIREAPLAVTGEGLLVLAGAVIVGSLSLSLAIPCLLLLLVAIVLGYLIGGAWLGRLLLRRALRGRESLLAETLTGTLVPLVAADVLPFGWVLIPLLCLIGVGSLVHTLRRRERPGPDGTAPPAPSGDRLRRLPGLFYALFFLEALLLEVMTNGGSPFVQIDMLNDEGDILRCLRGHGCNFGGLGSSVPSFVNPSGWLHLRTFLETIGLGVTGEHRLILVANAVGLVVTVRCAERLAGPLAGGLAACLSWLLLDPGAQPGVLYNTQPMMFLGAVFLATVIYAMKRPLLRNLVLASLCGAVMTGMYASSAPAVLSVVAAALRAPSRRFRLALGAVVAFCLPEYLIMPAGWVQDFSSLLHGTHNALHGSSARDGGSFGVLICAGLLALCIGPLLMRRRLRFALDAPVAVALPPLIVFIAAAGSGKITPDWKYLAHVTPALLVIAATALAVAVQASPSWRWPALRPSFAVLALLIPAGCGFPWAHSYRTSSWKRPRMSAVAAAGRVLTEERHWTWQQAATHLVSPDPQTLKALRLVMPDGSGTGDDTTALLLNVPADRVPSPLPDNWRLLGEDEAATTVLIFSRSWLDFRSFRLCREGPAGTDQCAEPGTLPAWSGLRKTEGTPGEWAASASGSRLVRLRIPVIAPEGAQVDRISINRDWVSRTNLCSATLTALRGIGAGVSVDPEGQTATLVRPPGPNSTAEVEMDWLLGGAECAGGYSVNFPPFLVEGDPGTALTVENVLPGQGS